ncbi:MAG: tetratricopeptide repeat protein [Candidatus Polarisedimenticolia bacterium]
MPPRSSFHGARWLAPALVLAALLVPFPVRAEVSRSQEIKARMFKLLNDGIVAVKEGRAKDAIAMLEKVTNVALNSFRAYYYLGLAYKADRQYQMAIEPLQVALELDPANLQARVTLGDCYLKRGDPAEALAEYHRAMEQQNDYAPAIDGLARAAEAAGDTEKAIESYRRAIELNPGFPDASMNLGDLLMREGRHNEAIDLFLQAIKVRPDFAAAYNRLGVAYARQRLGNEAIAALRQAELLEKGNAWHPVTIGAVFQDLDNLVQAGREYDKALALDPDYLDAYVAKAGLLRRMEMLPDAMVVLEAGLARQVEDARTQAKMREMKDSMAAEAATLADLATKLEAGPRTRADLVARADLRTAIGNNAAAVLDLQEALAILPEAAPEGAAPGPPVPTDTAILGRLAYSALRSGLFEEAAAACEKLLTVTPGNPDVLINLGLARTVTGDVAGAESAFRSAQKARPGDPRPLAYLANLYAIHGQRLEAIEALRSSLSLMEEGAEERQRAERLLKALDNGVPGGAAP